MARSGSDDPCTPGSRMDTSAVPAPPTATRSVAPDLASTPRQPVGSGWRDHPPVADGQRPQPVEQVVGDLIDDEGGPLLSHGESEAEQRAFDATCRKFSRFLAAVESSRARAKRSTNDEPSEPLTAPKQPGHAVRSQAPQPRSGAPQGAGLDGEPRGRSTIGCADLCGDPTDPPTPSHRTTKMQAT